MSEKWRILLLNTKDANPNYYIVLSIEQALRQHAAVEAVFNCTYDDAIPTAVRERANLLVAVDGEELDRGLCHRLAVLCGKSVLWVCEDPYDLALNRRNAVLFDHVFTNDSASVCAYDGTAAHLPFAANPRFHEQQLPAVADEARHYLYDVLFIGTAWPNRVQFLKELISRRPGLRWKLALPSNPHLPSFDLGIARSSYAWRVANVEMARLANRSRIVLGLHRDFALGGNSTAAATPGPRLFETALAGGFQLVDDSLPEVGTYYEPGREIVTFKTLDECAAKIEHYLAHPTERLTIARAAAERTRAEHLYAHRVARLLESVAVPAQRTSPPADRGLAGVAESNGSASRAIATSSAAKASKAPHRVLYVCHNHISLGGFGGVEVYVDLLARHLPPDIDPILYFPDRSVPEARLLRLVDVRRGTTRDVRFATPWASWTLKNIEREEFFGRLLHDERIDLVHFHHMLGHPWSLPLVARQQGIPTVMSVQDFYGSCTHFNLLNPQRRYCRATELPESACDQCLQEHDDRQRGTPSPRTLIPGRAAPELHLGRGSQSSRRGYVSAVFDAVDLTIYISQTARDHTQALLPIRPRTGQTIVEPLPIANEAVPQARARIELPLRVGVPGNLTHVKGGDALCRIFAATTKDPIEFHVFGRIDGPYDDILKSMRLPHVRLHGSYQPHEACEKLAACDVALMLSIWPETYVLTLSEAWRAGVVPIVTDIGALGERVSHQVNGFKVPVDEPSAVIAQLRDIIDQPMQLAHMRRNFHSGLYRLLDDHLEVLVGHYRRLLTDYRVADRGETYFDEAPHARPAGGSRAYHTAPDWPMWQNGTGAPVILSSAAANRTTLLRRARRYLHTHGVKATMRRAVRELFLRGGIRLP